MEKKEFINRIKELADRCEKTSCVTSSVFLTPAEQQEIKEQLHLHSDNTVLFMSGGAADSERKVCFFLPYWADAESFDVSEYIRALKIQSFFGTPGHRDYLGAVIGLGIERDRLGDIIVEGNSAYIFCLPSVAQLILTELDKVGSISVKPQEIPVSDVPVPERKVNLLSFTVKSMRLDALTGDMFGISRTQAAELIRLGAVSLNYNVCMKPDAQVGEGAVISVKGKGKGCITEIGGKSRKDRIFIKAERYM